MQTAILQFAKAPKLGTVKTRMMPFLKAPQALALHRSLFFHVADTINRWCDTSTANYELWLSEEYSEISEYCSKKAIEYRLQCEGNLGDRMTHATKLAMQKNDAVIVVGSDCPFICSQYLDSALSLLAEKDVVIGPAKDGGYVLIGMRQWESRIFENIPWGTGRVYQNTIERVQSLKLELGVLSSLSDIDRPEDLALLDQFETIRF